jgi:hypothetical protein
MRVCSAQYVIDPEMLTHIVRATREIAEGEEITISCELHNYGVVWTAS